MFTSVPELCCRQHVHVNILVLRKVIKYSWRYIECKVYLWLNGNVIDPHFFFYSQILSIAQPESSSPSHGMFIVNSSKPRVVQTTSFVLQFSSILFFSNQAWFHLHSNCYENYTLQSYSVFKKGLFLTLACDHFSCR